MLAIAHSSCRAAATRFALNSSALAVVALKLTCRRPGILMRLHLTDTLNSAFGLSRILVKELVAALWSAKELKLSLIRPELQVRLRLTDMRQHHKTSLVIQTKVFACSQFAAIAHSRNY